MVSHRQIYTHSLWFGPQQPTTLRLDRWQDYPHFFDTLEEYEGAVIPEEALVTWQTFDDFVRYPFDDERDWTFVKELVKRMRSGEDIPPLVREPDGEPSDGRHRAFAAARLGIKLAPTITVARWSNAPVAE